MLMVLAFVLLSELTKAWLLYLGLIFLFMVMYAPGGIASLIMMNLRVASYGKLRRLLPHYLAWRRRGSWRCSASRPDDRDGLSPQLDGAAGSTLNFLGLTLDDANSWVAGRRRGGAGRHRRCSSGRAAASRALGRRAGVHRG
jgi:branched-chain amino acid transport system permease protein